MPADAIPPNVVSVTGLINFNNPRDAWDLFSGNYRAADPDLGEVQLGSMVFAQIDLRDQDGSTFLGAAGCRLELDAGVFRLFAHLQPAPAL